MHTTIHSIGAPSTIPGSLSSAQQEFQKKLGDMNAATSSLKAMAEDAPRASKHRILGGLLQQIESMNAATFSPKTWNVLMKAYGKAKAVLLGKKPTVKDLQKAIALIRSALSQLEQAERREEEEEKRQGLPLVMKYPETGAAQAAQAPAAPAAPAGGSVDVSV